MSKISKHFDLREFVSEVTWKTYGEKSIWFIDPRLITLAEFVREWFKAPMTINDWSTGGGFQNRGYRRPKSTVGASESQHRFGRAIDINIQGFTPQQIYKIIIGNEKAFMDAGLTTLENIVDTPSWNHLDIRQTNLSQILIVNR